MTSLKRIGGFFRMVRCTEAGASMVDTISKYLGFNERD
jgi:hypothetical protein